MHAAPLPYSGIPINANPALFQRPRFQLLTLIIVVFILYAPSFNCGFLWDDNLHVTNNPVTRPSGLYRAWVGYEQTNYWPVTWTITWIFWKLWGFNAAGFHFVNVAMHAVCSILVWRVLLKLSVPAAWFAAVLFAVHPVNVENVTWISQLKSLLSSAFFLASLLTYFRYHGNEPGSRRGRSYLLSLLFFAIALLSKTSAAPLPCVIALLLWWKGGITSLRRSWLPLIPFVLMAVAQTFGEIWFQTHMASAGGVRSLSFLSRTIAAGWNAAFYMEKALLPINLSFIYPLWHIDAALWTHWLPLIAWILVFITALVAAGRNLAARAAFTAMTYYMLMLAPVLGFVDASFFRYSSVADHYQYLALPSICALAAAGIYRHGHNPRFAIAASVILLAAFSTLSWNRQQDYRDPVTLWKDTVKKNPTGYLPRDVLGTLLYSRGNYQEALYHFQEAVRIEPDDLHLQQNVASVLFKLQRLDEAEKILIGILNKAPMEQFALFLLGDVYLSEKKPEAAAEQYKKAQRVNPLSELIGTRMARVHIQMNRKSEAELQLRRVVRRHPRSVEAHLQLAAIYDADGRTTEAQIVRQLMKDTGIQPQLN